MYDEFDKCKFCIHYDEYKGCEYGCYEYGDFEPNKDRLMRTAKEKDISVTDLLTLINL